MINQIKDAALIGDYLKQVKRQVRLEDNKKYKLLGVRWYGQGMFLREEKLGKEIKADKLYRVHTGDFVYNRLFAWKSSFAIVEEELNGCLVSNEFPTFEYDQQKINPYFLLNYVLQPTYIDFVNRQSGGMSSVSRKRFKEEDFLQSTFPKYSNSKQKHIAVKIRNTRSRFSDLTLLLEEQLSNLSLLRQTILQEAIEGKLTADWRKKHPELISDENHASKLLEKIKAEKIRLIKEGKIKKEKSLLPIADEEKPFDLPKGWVWSRFQEIAILITDGKHGDCQNQPNSGYYFLSAKDIQNEKLLYDFARQINKTEFNEVHRRTDLKPGDICMVNTGATVGKLAIAPHDPKTQRTTFQKSVAVIKLLHKFTCNEYIKCFLSYDVKNLLKKSWGSAINNLILSDLKNKLVPIPPLAEQQAIVERVEKIMSMIDELEKQVTERKDKSERLMQSVLREAFEQ